MSVDLEMIFPNDDIASISQRLIVLNDLPDLTQDDRELVDGIILTKFKGDLLENLPRCSCNKHRGYPELGVVCDVCGYEVTDPQGDLEPIVWIRKPSGIKALMTPQFFLMLRETFTVSRFSVIDWLLDPYYARRANQYPAWMIKIEQLNLPRGWNNFVENFDHIIQSLASVKEFYKQPKDGRRRVLSDFLRMLEENRRIVFCDYIAVPNKAILVLEEESTATYVDDIFIGASDAIRKMVGIDTEHSALTVQEQEKRTYGLLNNLAIFYDDIYQTFFAKKKGIYRKNVYAARADWSFRAVISSIDGPCDGDEIHIPWGVAITVFRTHLMSVLMAEGMSPNRAKAFISDHVHVFNEKLYGILMNMIARSPEAGIRCIFNRNPSMSRSSILSMRITRIKTNLLDLTVSIPNPIAKLPNADFDGDQCNFALDIDRYMTELMYGMRPHMNMFDTNRVRKLNDLLALPKPQAAMLGNMFDLEDD